MSRIWADLLTPLFTADKNCAIFIKEIFRFTAFKLTLALRKHDRKMCQLQPSNIFRIQIPTSLKPREKRNLGMAGLSIEYRLDTERLLHAVEE